MFELSDDEIEIEFEQEQPRCSNKSVVELMNELKRLPLLNKEQQENLIQEFVDNHYFKQCNWESNIDQIVFYLLNYALILDDLIDQNVLELLKDLFSHLDHCFYATDHKEISCKITSKLFRSNWLKVYFETVSKIYDYDFNLMNDQLIEFMYILFKKTANKQAFNVDYLTVINFLISNTTASLGKIEDQSKKNHQPVLCERKRKIVLLIILILDGQYQPFLDKIQLKKVATFLDMNGIRMYWQNLNEFDNVKAHVEEIVKFCKNLIESHNGLND